MGRARAAAKIDGAKGDSRAPKKVFAFFVCDESGLEESPKVVLQGSSVAAWSSQRCEEFAQLFDAKPKFAITDMVLPGGVRVEYLTPAEKAPARGVIIGAGREAIPENGDGDFILPPFELQALAQVLKRAVSNGRPELDNQPVKQAV